ncbi:MAG: sugar transferase, partial [Planctomycetes bacterium]|nr:sugar transferase [Planctomycetota bacterium]
MFRQSRSPRVELLTSFDPFCGPATVDEADLELIDLMGFTQQATPARVPLPDFEPSLDLQLGITLSRWDLLAPKGFYSSFLQPFLTLALMLVAGPISLMVMLPIALVNWIALGDHRLIFFTQDRVGQYGRVFRIYKFRTMRPIDGEDFAAWSRGDQNRVTRLGRFLRSTHLDEVPQILNILLGDMDFIGPRPEMISVHNWACQEVPGFERRLALRPGITGLAQITQGYAGQCAEAYTDKLVADEDYRERLSFRLDTSILVRTVFWMLRGRGWQW